MVYLPKGYGGGDRYPVFYGLHNYTASETMWLEYAGIGKVADEMIEKGEIKPLVMVFPLTRYDPAKAIQEDMKDGIRDASQMEQFLVDELVPYIDTSLNTIKSPDSRSIGGFSMGGMFALETAFRHPDLFGKVGGYSPALMYSDFSGRQFEKWLFPRSDPDGIPDAAVFAREKRLDKLKVYLDCGMADDPFSVGIQSLYEALKARGIYAELDIHKGGHTLQLNRIEDFLLFYSGVE
jgi:enterochelin esterase-like enzyme